MVDGDLSVVHGQSQVVGEVVGPDNLYAYDPLQIASRKGPVKLHTDYPIRVRARRKPKALLDEALQSSPLPKQRLLSWHQAML